MDTDELLRLRKKAFGWAVKMGFRQYADDIAQQCCVLWLEGKNKHSSVRQTVIDSIRIQFSRPKHANDKQSFIRKTTAGYNDLLKPFIRHNNSDLRKYDPAAHIPVHPFDQIEARIDVEKLLKLITRPDYLYIVCQFYLYGVRPVTIARQLNVDPAQIWQILDRAAAQIYRDNRKLIRKSKWRLQSSK